jgi:hypothetical protein
MRDRASFAFGRWCLVGSCAVAAALAMGGCAKLKQKLAEKAAERVAATDNAAGVHKPSPADLADEQLQEKADAYIHCVNSISETMHGAEHRYRDWCPEKGPTGKERTIYGISAGPGQAMVTECVNGAKKAAGLPPPNATLDAAGAEYAKNASALQPLITDAEKYYEHKDYKDDKFAKGKDLHTKLVPAFKAFDAAAENLDKLLDEITKPLSQRLLARIEREDGKKFLYHRRNTMMAARALADSGDDREIDFAPYNTAYLAFEKAFGDLKTYGDANKKSLDDPKSPERQSQMTSSSNYDSFAHAAEEYQKTAKAMLRCLRAAPAKAKTKAGKIDVTKLPRCDDADDGIVKQFNHFIEEANRNPFP